MRNHFSAGRLVRVKAIYDLPFTPWMDENDHHALRCAERASRSAATLFATEPSDSGDDGPAARVGVGMRADVLMSCFSCVTDELISACIDDMAVRSSA